MDTTVVARVRNRGGGTGDAIRIRIRFRAGSRIGAGSFGIGTLSSAGIRIVSYRIRARNIGCLVHEELVHSDLDAPAEFRRALVRTRAQATLRALLQQSGNHDREQSGVGKIASQGKEDLTGGNAGTEVGADLFRLGGHDHALRSLRDSCWLRNRDQSSSELMKLLRSARDWMAKRPKMKARPSEPQTGLNNDDHSHG